MQVLLLWALNHQVHDTAYNAQLLSYGQKQNTHNTVFIFPTCSTSITVEQNYFLPFLNIPFLARFMPASYFALFLSILARCLAWLAAILACLELLVTGNSLP